MRSRHIHITVNLDRVRANAEALRRRLSARIIAVIKADAYGLGAPEVADTLASVVDEFGYFSIHEAREVGRPGIVLGPPDAEPAAFHELRLRPAISTFEDAARFADIPVAVKLDTGMQRFGCVANQLDKMLRRTHAQDIFTHAMTMPAVERLKAATGGRAQWRHAASTSLLEHPDAWLDAVRPGLALYRGAVRATTRLATVRKTAGGVGYTQFEHEHVGVILAGYANQLRAGPVQINGRSQRILEVGMNTAFVSVDPSDRAGDEVVLLDESLDESKLAAHFNCRPHEIFCRYCSMGIRTHVCDGTVRIAANLESAHSSAAG